jgi:hypothetical protein
MTPVEKAKSIRPETFRDELEAHLLGGFVLSTPTAFVMGRPIARVAPHALQADPWFQFPSESCDCWLVWLASGDLASIWRLVPYPLPWLAWARRDGALKFKNFSGIESALAEIKKRG